jgi:fused signal recognition particle receptor
LFESLKKKLSRASDKLEEEIIEEAKQEDNLQEEEGKKRSFFSFGRKKEKKEVDESKLIESSEKDSADEEPKVEKKSRFWSRSKDKDEDSVLEEGSDDVVGEDSVDEEPKVEKKSHFWSRNKDKKDEESVDEDVSDDIVDEESAVEDVSDDFVGEDSVDEEPKVEKKSHFWSRNKDKKDEESAVEDVSDDFVGEDSVDEEPKVEKKSRFWSRNKDKDDEPVVEDGFDDVVDEDSDDEEEPKVEKKSHFWSRNKDKDDDSPEGKGGLFSFVREKTISEKHVEDTLWELEMGLLEGDVAMEVATEVVESVKEDLVGRRIKRSSDITEYTYNALRNAVAEIIDIPGKSMTEMIEEKKAQGEPLVVMFVGINGTGKTTTIGKLANYYLKMGYTPVIAASDTFRAGAIEQVTHHADNVGVKIIKHQKGSDPAAVAFDAVEHARAQGKELVLIDTAGRMQTNTNLMDEMKKIKRVSNPDLVIFVGDALTGNDATEQAAKFNEAIDIDGVILTKADADSKGGASLSIGYVIKKPIMFLGVGQGYDDIMEYDSEWMLNQLFSEDEATVEE